MKDLFKVIANDANKERVLLQTGNTAILIAYFAEGYEPAGENEELLYSEQLLPALDYYVKFGGSFYDDEPFYEFASERLVEIYNGEGKTDEEQAALDEIVTELSDENAEIVKSIAEGTYDAPVEEEKVEDTAVAEEKTDSAAEEQTDPATVVPEENVAGAADETSEESQKPDE